MRLAGMSLSKVGLVGLVGLVGSIGLIAGCGGGDGGNNMNTPDSGTMTNECTPGQAFDITGKHAVEATLNVLVNASIIRDKPTTAKVYLLADLVQTGTTATVVGTVCKLDIPPVPLEGQDPIIFSPGPGLIESIKPVPVSGMLGGTTTCSAFNTADALTVIVGADLTPATAVLPQATTAGDPGMYCGGNFMTACDPDPAGTNCACDQERDMKAGATLLAMNIPGLTDIKEIYASLRTTIRLNGMVWSSDDIRGTVDATLDIGVLDCLHVQSATSTSPCTKVDRAALKGFSPAISQNPAVQSTFLGKRVPAGTTCAQLIPMLPTLFPR